MEKNYVVSILVSKVYTHIFLNSTLAAKYPQLDFKCFSDMEEYRNSDHWRRTDILAVQFRSPDEFDEALSNNPIKWVHSFTAGVDAYMTEYFKASPVPLTNARGAYNDSLAEYCLAAMLFFNKKFQQLEQQKQSKNYQVFLMPTLYQSTLVVLGYGSIGKSVARIGKNFGMRVIGVKRTATEPDGIADEIVDTSKLNEVLPSADFLVMAMPNHPTTYNLMSAPQFSLMKRSAALVNVGRGSSINEDDLAEALNNELIAGAALDVFKVEPLPESSPLWTAKNLIISPHNADMVEDLADLCIGCFEGHLKNFLSGQPFSSVVDKVKGY
ncbi:unnamed protein product [Blepharisma stoltei]|uniref:D-isomer specific 2-hydroxyacid dehydrogenase NAD-binding domain-containing protein n=1 Tax=Blepharisma stoltei TaxID=1481888 RepID=A0AAU9KFE6_9CILI|nr:unnamed protein product [Blepharisma stoltei]